LLSIKGNNELNTVNAIILDFIMIHFYRMLFVDEKFQNFKIFNYQIFIFIY